MWNASLALSELDRDVEELAVCDEIIARYQDAPEPSVRACVAGALLSKGAAAGNDGRPARSIAIYDELVVRYGDLPEARDSVVIAMINMGSALRELGRPEEAVALYDDVIARCADAAEPEVREALARARADKAEALAAWRGSAP